MCVRDDNSSTSTYLGTTGCRDGDRFIIFISESIDSRSAICLGHCQSRGLRIIQTFVPHGAAALQTTLSTLSPPRVAIPELYDNHCRERETVRFQLWLVTPHAVGLWVGKTLGKLPLS